jgi:glycosyltransferase involved in cell wall biosynthesis
MPTELQLSVILTTYQRPAHLERCLHCLSLQQGVDGKFEVIIADDGSQDTTEEIARSVARSVTFPVKWVTHPHRGFRAALCRNDGIRASSAPYLLFVDCDCLLPRDHLQKHLEARRPGVVRAGECLRLDQAATERVDKKAIEAEEYRNWVSREERNRFLQQKIKNHYYQLIRHSTKPKLIAYDFGIWREDIEAVNGFDEAFVGWGCEDDDLAYRLRRAGRRIQSVLEYTHGYHMWHPTEPSRPALWKLGTNVLRLLAPQRPIQCVNGLISTVETSDEVSLASSDSVSIGPSNPARSAA